MKAFDRLLQSWRIAKTRPYIRMGASVLDVGCADGALFRMLKSQISRGVGIDSHIGESAQVDRCKLIQGQFPEDLRDEDPFDVITMLAVLEHVPPEHQVGLAVACSRVLKPQGYLVITVPSPKVDPILNLLKRLRIIDGMSLEQHYGFEPNQIPSIFGKTGLKLIEIRKFQLGLNNLYLFQKDTVAA